jgi:haloalkane dehalogenase
MEAILYHYSWEQWPEAARPIFKALRTDDGEAIILEKNVFIENILPSSIIRKLSDEEMDAYRRPFANSGEDRRPTLTWPRQLPIEGKPEDVVEIVETYGKWLMNSNIPKLFINAEPGVILTGEARDFCSRWSNQEEVTVKGLHFIQEDSPDEIGQAVAGFVQNLDA